MEYSKYRVSYLFWGTNLRHMLVKICLQILDFEKKQNRLNIQVITSSVTLCEKKKKKKRQNFAQLVGVVFAHGETSS